MAEATHDGFELGAVTVSMTMSSVPSNASRTLSSCATTVAVLAWVLTVPGTYGPLWGLSSWKYSIMRVRYFIGAEAPEEPLAQATRPGH